VYLKSKETEYSQSMNSLWHHLKPEERAASTDDH